MFKIQDYYQADQVSYSMSSSGMKDKFESITFQYVPANKDANASLSFHLTNSEKRDIAAALNNSTNRVAFAKVINLSTLQMSKK